MSDLEREATVWCPRCRVAKYHVLRKPTEREGVHEHVHEWIEPIPNSRDPIVCKCGATLERRPASADVTAG